MKAEFSMKITHFYYIKSLLTIEVWTSNQLFPLINLCYTEQTGIFLLLETNIPKNIRKLSWRPGYFTS